MSFSSLNQHRGGRHNETHQTIPHPQSLAERSTEGSAGHLPDLLSDRIVGGQRVSGYKGATGFIPDTRTTKTSEDGLPYTAYPPPAISGIGPQQDFQHKPQGE